MEILLILAACAACFVAYFISRVLEDMHTIDYSDTIEQKQLEAWRAGARDRERKAHEGIIEKELRWLA